MKRILLPLLGSAVLLSVGILALVQRRASFPSGAGSPEAFTVVASFYPLAEFARQVAGQHATVVQIAPAGVDAHEVQLSPQSIVTLRSADVFLYNGGIEPWAERMHEEVARRGVHVINMLRALGMENVVGDANGGEGVNPHIWLDPVLVQRQVEVIRDAFAEADPAHAQNYRANAERYRAKLRELDAVFRERLGTCAHQDLIVAHDGFRHLAERYGLRMVPLAGSSPEEEARPRRLAEIVQHARSTGIRVVFSEALVSSRTVEAFARETGAEVRPLHPLEGLTSEELRGGKDYLSLMQENLRQLREGLECT